MRNGKDAASGSFCIPHSAFRIPSPWSSAARIWLILMGLQFLALLTAGVFWVSETFIQLSLWRFSPHAKLLAVSAVAVWIMGCHHAERQRWIIYSFGTLASAAIAAAAVGGFNSEAGIMLVATAASLWWITAITGTSAIGLRGHRLAASILVVALGLPAAALVGAAGRGEILPPGQWHSDAPVLAAGKWASLEANTDSLFLLPPDASAFSLHARRGQVVSFKLVPQLSGELIEWDRRLREVLDVADLSIYAGGVRGYRLSQEAMRRRYDELPAEHLFEVARRYGARYVFRSSADEGVGEEMIAWRGETGAVMYDLTLGTASPSGEAVAPPATGEAAAPDAAGEEEIR